MEEGNGIWSTIGHRIVDLVKRKFLNASHGAVDLAKRKLGAVGTKFLDRAGTSAEKKFTNLLGKNVGQAAVNLGKRKLGEVGNSLLDHGGTMVKRKMTDIFEKKKETKNYMNDIPHVL